MKKRLLILNLFFLASSLSVYAQAPNLKTILNFSLFTTTGAVGNTGNSVVAQKIGTNDGAITGFTLWPGQSENANSITAQAAIDLQEAYDLLRLSPQTFPTHAAVLGNGETLYPGTHLISEAASIEGDLTLDALSDPDAIFIIRIEGAFSPGPSSQIILSGGALSCNVYWAVEGGAIAIAAASNMKGNFIANPGAVSMAATSTLEGRLLSTTGAVAVDAVEVTMPSCFQVLPLRLVDFNITKEVNGIKLTWSAINESSFSGYEVQRSMNGSFYDSMAFIASAGGSGLVNYNWFDQTAVSSVYYRLKMMDMDGSFYYSPVRFFSNHSLNRISIFPNPVSEQDIQLQILEAGKGEYRIMFYNTAGVKLNEIIVANTTEGGIRTFPIKHRLSSGLYFMVINDPAGLSQTIRFLVK